MSMRRILRSVLLLIFLSLCRGFDSIKDARVTRELQQRKQPRVEITTENVNTFQDIVSRAEPDTVFHIETDVELSTLISVEIDGLTFKGSRNQQPSIRCASEQGGFSIRSTGVKFEHLVIRDCHEAAIRLKTQSARRVNNSSTSSGMDLTVDNVALVNNEAFTDFFADPAGASSGGLVLEKRTRTLVSNCEFRNNRGSTGGAIYFAGSSLVVKDSHFHGNSAEYSGGAVHAFASGKRLTARGAQLRIVRSVFAKNKVLNGREDTSGLQLNDVVPVERNVVLHFPLPSPSGGAIFASDLRLVTISQCNFTRNRAVPSGGAAYFGDNSQTVIDECRFENNHAAQDSNQRLAGDLLQGGALFVAFADSESKIRVQKSEFSENQASYGGAIHFVGSTESQATISETKFTNNSARLGGGAAVLRNSEEILIVSSIFTSNHAFAGGAILLANNAGMTVQRELDFKEHNRFSNNTAFDGGANYAIGATRISQISTIFEFNRAKRHGGAICFVNSVGGSLSFDEAKLTGNSAKKGGAVYMEHAWRFFSAADPRDPNAEFLGITEKPKSEFVDNVAEAGGAIYYRASNVLGNRFFISRTLFQRNRALAVLPSSYDVHIDSSVQYAVDAPTTDNEDNLSYRDRKERLLDLDTSEPCHPGGGGAICLILTSVPDLAPAQVQLRESNFTKNRAVIGGSLLVANGRKSIWTATCSRPASDSVVTSEIISSKCRSIQFGALNFTLNRALIAGGAIFGSNLRQIHYFSDLSDVELTESIPLDSLETMKNFVKNKVGSDGYGHDIAGAAVRLKIIHPVIDQQSGLLLSNQSGGQFKALSPITVAVLDSLGSVINGGITDSTIQIQIAAFDRDRRVNIVAGQISSTTISGIGRFDGVSLTAAPGSYRLRFFVLQSNVDDDQGDVKLRDCLLGERLDETGFVCEACVADTFIFYSNATRCAECPPNAICSGRASLVPAPGYWHSSYFSVVMHRCFHNKACDYSDRTERLEDARSGFLQDYFQRFQDSMPVPSNEDYRQCAVGYTGPLCGSCEEGYGNIEGKFCVRCSSETRIYVILCVLALGQFLIVGLTLRSALSAIRDMNELHAVADQQIALVAASSQITLQDRVGSALAVSVTYSTRFSRSTIDSIDEHQDNVRQDRLPTVHSDTEAPITDSERIEKERELRAKLIIASVHISEIIKIFVNFFQVTSVAGSIDLDWTPSVSFMLNAMDSVSGLANRAAFAPLTCLANLCVGNRSIYGVALRISFHVILMILLMFFSVLRRIATGCSGSRKQDKFSRSLKSSLVISFLVVVFFGYQSISEDLMGTISCIRLDSKDLEQIYDNYDPSAFGSTYSQFSIATGDYWTEDTSVRCWSGAHARLTRFLGVPGIVLFLCGVPLWLFVFLLVKRKKDQLLDLHVLNTYGFIYQNYNDKHVFWEVLIMTRKALMGAIIVFAYRLEANLQGVMALGALIVALALHLVAIPFKYKPLNALEGMSLIVSIFTFYSGIVFHDENTAESVRTAFSVFLICINALLMLLILCTIFFYLDRYAEARLRLFNSPHVPHHPISRIKLLLSYKTKEVRDILKSITERMRRGVLIKTGIKRGRSLQQTISNSKNPADSNQPATSI